MAKTCKTGKIRYPSQRLALKALIDGAHGLAVHFCHSCDGWHTTSSVRHKPVRARRS